LIPRGLTLKPGSISRNSSGPKPIEILRSSLAIVGHLRLEFYGALAGNISTIPLYNL